MNTIRLFCDIARLKSFSQAAAQHEITQSAASQRIQQLEKRLGVTLIDRSVRPLRLTEKGTLYFRGCKKILQRYDHLVHEVLQRNGLPGETVLVASIYSAGITMLSELQKAFKQVHPQHTVSIEYKRPEDVEQAIITRSCEIGILSYPEKYPGLNHIPLRNEVMTVVCGTRHPIASQKSIHPRQLEDTPMVLFDPRLPVARETTKYLRSHGANPEPAHVFDNIDTIKAIVAAEPVVAILPKRLVLDEVSRGQMALVELEPGFHRPLGIVYPRHRRGREPFSPATRLFVDYLLEHVKKDQIPARPSRALAREEV